MALLFLLLFVVVAVAAASFAIVPSLRAGRGWLAPALAAAAVVLGGLGTYVAVGQPGIAIESFATVDADASQQNYPALISRLARTMRDRPNDPQGWTFLGQGYMAFGQTGEAVKAYARAVALRRLEGGEAPPDLLAAYGVALSLDGGEVTAAAEEIFRAALAQDPKNQDARYHLGMAHAQRGENEAAIQFWEPLVTEASPEMPWRAAMFQQLAILKGRTGQAPDPQAMVARLVARLAADPKNLDGWLLLIQSYGVLGEKEKAHEALASAQAAFAGDEQALGALAAKARETGVQ